MIKLKFLKKLAYIVCAFVFAITANVAQANCISDLYSCGKKSGTLGYEILENQAEMLAYITEGTPCALALAAHDPITTVFSGAILVLGATGTIDNHKQGCKNDIYGLAAKPIAAVADGILPGNSYQEQVIDAGASVVESLFYSIQLPSVIPNAGVQIDCGCHLLGIGAKSADSAREVAAAAAAAYKGCEKATKSCPGLKEALVAGKWITGAAGDAVEFVGKAACELADGDGPAVTPQHMYQTHFEYMLSSQLEQDLADIQMTGSGHQSQFDAEMGFCTRHYDNRCQNGGRICTAIAQQTYNPAYHKILLEKLNGELFNKYQPKPSSNPSPASLKTCPGPAGISLSGDGSDTTALLNDVSKRCQEEVNVIVNGSNGQPSLAQLARNNLPQTIDGPNGWNAKITTGKWITDSQKVYAEALQLAQMVIKPLADAVKDKYTQEYKTIADQGEVAMVPYDYLDKTYRGWTVFKLASAIDKCPAGLVNFKGHEKQCVTEMAEAFGYNLSAAVTQGEFQSVEQITGSALKGSAVYDITRGAFLNHLQQNKPVINIKNQTQDVKNEIAYNRAKAAWQSAGEPAASQAANNAIPQVLAQAGERQADLRTAQEARIIDLQTRLKVPYDTYLLKCKNKQCQDEMYKKWVTLADKINAERTALQQVTAPNKAFDVTKLDALVKKYQKEITDIEAEFKSIVNLVSNQVGRINSGVSNLDKVTKDKKVETLDKSGFKVDDSTPTLKDQSKDSNLPKGFNKLAGDGNSRPEPEAKPQVRGMRAAPGMITATNGNDKYKESKSGGLTSNSLKPNSAPDNQDGKPAAVSSLEESQNALKNRVGSQGIKDETPSRVGTGFDIAAKSAAPSAVAMPRTLGLPATTNASDAAQQNTQGGRLSTGVSVAVNQPPSSNPAAPSSVMMPRAIGLPATANASDAAQQNSQGGRLSPGVSIAANQPPSAALPPISGMTKPADNVGLGNLNNTRGLAAMPVGNIGNSVAVNAGISRAPVGASSPSAPPPVKGIADNTSLSPSAAPMAPFDRQQYLRVARQNLEAKWVPQCKNEPCKSEISTLVTKRINEVLKMLDTGTDLRNNGILMATEAKMDATYNPQMQARIDASVPKAVDNTPVTAPQSTVPVESVKNINSIKKRNF